MQLECPHCHAVLEFAERRPAFCGYCGQSLSTTRARAADPPPRPASAPTVDFDPEAATLAPPAGVVPDGPPAAEPDTIGGYRLLRPLGCGGMGTVYEAEEIASGRRVALKLISANSGSREAAERFRREGRLASALQHPRCVFVLAADEDAGRPYIVMELMSGTTLHDLVKEKGPLPVQDAVARILDVIDGLHEAHQLGVVHRDMKPSNCFLDADGRVKVGDFGLAKTLSGDTHLTKTGSFMGTALFASPEQVRADPVDQRSDVYAVAATLYFLLTGRAPHQTGDAAATLARIVSDPAPSMRTVRPEIPAALDQVVLRGLERSRDRRWPDLGEMREALLALQPGRFAVGALGLRFAAHLIDWLLVCAVVLAVLWGYGAVAAARGRPAVDILDRPALPYVVADVIWFLYFAVLEGLWGASLGKRWLGLRLGTAPEGGWPGWARVLLRTGIWFVLIPLPWLVAEVALRSGALIAPPGVPVIVVGLALMLFTRIVGTALLLCPMRPDNRYQGLHDWLTGTCVLAVTAEERRRATEPAGAPAILGRRFGAYLVDSALFFPLVLLGEPLAWLLRPAGPPDWAVNGLENVAFYLPWSLYTIILEGLWGWSVGKGLFRLRVRRADGDAAPGLGRALVRTALFAVVPLVTGGLAALADRASGGEAWALWALAAMALDGLVFGSTMRRANGWRGPHELLSGTRVVLLPETGPRALEGRRPDRLTEGLTRPAGMPERVGPFVVRGALRWTGADKVLLAEDPVLNRTVGIQLHPGSEGPVAANRREVNRPTRLRWLGSGRQGEFFWDAYLCPTGSPLADVVSPDAPLTWAEARPLLVQLLDELLDACEDGTLPRTLTVEQVWVQPNGRLQLLGTPLAEPAEAAPAGTDEERALELLRRVAVLALEGNPRPAERPPTPVRAPLPGHAAAWLDRLLGVRGQYNALGHAHFDLSATRALPTQVTRGMRTAQVAILALLHLPGLAVMVVTASYLAFETHELDAEGLLCAGLIPVVWVFWAFACRGSSTFHLMGLRLVRANGQPAWRLQCAWRALLIWAPVAGGLLLSVWLASRVPEALDAPDFLPAAVPATAAHLTAVALPLLYLVLAIVFPSRGPHDRLAGTYLVPR
jgi:uncharacterized RDD family membrane protein YckC